MRPLKAIPLLLVLAAGPAHAGPLPFTEEAAARGVVYTTNIRAGFGHGVAFADLDNDGDPDLIALGRQVTDGDDAYTTGLYENDGTGHFTLRSLTNPLPHSPQALGVTAADYDADGDLDLYLSCWLAPNLLLRNDGDWNFTDVARDAGVDDTGAGQGCAWGDIDLDGNPDLYVTNRTGSNITAELISQEPNRLFVNLADGTFRSIGTTAGVDGRGDPSFQASFFDADNDGDPDLYLANDKGWSRNCQVRNRMWINDGNGTFIDISAQSGADGCIDAMCSAIGDVNADGLQDIYLTNQPVGNVLYLNNGGNTFIDATDAFGVASYQLGWGACFFDYDNDTNLDLYVCQSFNTNRLYRHTGTGCVDVAPQMNVDDPHESFSCAYADIDDDGDLDLAVADRAPRPDIPGRLRLFINHAGSNANWLKLRVVGPGRNTWGIGTRIVVRTDGREQTREVIAGDGFKSQHDLTVHFGLAQAGQPEAIFAHFPGGDVRRLTGYPPNHTWTVYPDDRLADFDNDGQVTMPDIIELVRCFISSRHVTGGCELADVDSNGTISVIDLLLGLDRLFAP